VSPLLHFANRWGIIYFAGVCSSVNRKTILISESPIPPTLRIHNIYSVMVEILLLIWKSWLAGGAMEKLKRK